MLTRYVGCPTHITYHLIRPLSNPVTLENRFLYITRLVNFILLLLCFFCKSFYKISIT